MKTAFEKIIKETILNKHYTITEFCQAVGLSRQGFYNLCNGVHGPSEETMKKINDFLGTSLTTETKHRSKPHGQHKKHLSTVEAPEADGLPGI